MICPECGVERQVVLCPPCTEKRVQELFSQIDREKKERREAVDRLYATEVAASKERDALLLQNESLKNDVALLQKGQPIMRPDVREEKRLNDEIDRLNRLISAIQGHLDRALNDKMPTCCNAVLSEVIDSVNEIVGKPLKRKPEVDEWGTGSTKPG